MGIEADNPGNEYQTVWVLVVINYLVSVATWQMKTLRWKILSLKLRANYDLKWISINVS